MLKKFETILDSEQSNSISRLQCGRIDARQGHSAHLVVDGTADSVTIAEMSLCLELIFQLEKVRT